VPLLPLFPLDVVLFPGTPLPLHIFEPRYKEMIGESLANDSPFGIIRGQQHGLSEIGCTAQIVSVSKQYPDGRLDIVTEGRNRFEILQLNQERSFLRGEILLISDEPGKATSEETARAIQLHADILALAGATQDLSAADHSVLSFYLAGSLPLDLDFKQKLLEMRSEKLRIAALIEYLDAILPKIRRATRARTVSGGNGHAH
jgi:Lon protease-like protein